MAGAGSTSSTTSNTLTFAPGMVAFAALSANGDVRPLLETLALPEKRHVFLQPQRAIPAASLELVKSTLDGFAGQISDEQLRKLKEEAKNKNRKRRREPEGGGPQEVLKIRRVHVDGFETAQVWQQAKRIISSALAHSREALRELEERQEVVQNGLGHDEDMEGEDEGEELVEEEEDEEEGEEEDDGEDEDEEDGLEEDEDAELEAAELDDEEGLSDLEEQEDEDDDSDFGQNTDEYVEDPNGLNDGFFSIDDFNRQTQWFEEQDAKGDPYTDQASDDEDVDWDADPLTTTPGQASKPSKKRDGAIEEDFGLDVDDDDDGEESDGGPGPTFGNMDLNAPEGASDDEAMDGEPDDDMDLNANEIYYKDFFAPPPKKAQPGRTKKALRFEKAQVQDADVDRAIADVRRDLFEDLSDHDGTEDALSDVSDSDIRSRRSAHERRLAKIAEEIRKLEKAAIEKKEWTMTGEATAAERPMNSLLEQDLDYEHAGKPVPVITAEVSEDIEDMIKRRILAQEFDEVLRRRPDVDSVPSSTRRGLVEFDDGKSKKSLAELYEEDHVRKSNPDSYVSQSDELRKKEEQAVEKMWRDLSSQLDALSSWHYKPRPTEAAITVVADVAAVRMEDAQPATALGVAGGGSTMAPQEVYKAGKDTAEQGEVVTKAGMPLARQELTREEKLRRRRREKERIKKAGSGGKQPVSKSAQIRKDTMAGLKKGGVKVISKKGEVVGLDGKKTKEPKAVTSGSYKL